MKKPILTLVVCVCVAIATFEPGRGEIVNGIACKVGGQIITMNEFEVAFRSEKRRAYLMGLAAPSKREVMENLIDELLVTAEATRRGIVVTDEEVQKIIENIKSENKLTDEQLARELEKEGLTVKDLSERYRTEILKARLANQLGMERKTSVTEEEMRGFYDEPTNRGIFTRPGIVKLSQVYIAVPENASYREMLDIKQNVQSVVERARNGEDFSTLVRDYSNSPDKEKNLGSVGSFSRQQLARLLNEEDVERIFALDAGGVSDPVRFADGYYIFKVDGRIEEKVVSYEEARENIRGYIMKLKSDEHFSTWLEGRRRATPVEYMIEVD